MSTGISTGKCSDFYYLNDDTESKCSCFLCHEESKKKKKGLQNDKTIVASLLNDVALCNNVVRFEKICIFSKANIK